MAVILGNPFYCGLIEIKRTGKTWNGIHAPIISARLFKQVQERKAGRAGKKVTRHNHLFRGLFRCGVCDAPMVPELQKGRVYYRCQTSVCKTKTIRQDRLEAAIAKKLAELELSDMQASRLKTEWLKRLAKGEDVAALRGIELRISECRARVDRLTDLLIDGVLATSDFDQRKRSLSLELAQLEEEKTDAVQNRITVQDVEQFLQQMKSLAALYGGSTDNEKRRLLENVFGRCVVVGKIMDFEVLDWISSRNDFSRLPSAHQIGASKDVLNAA